MHKSTQHFEAKCVISPDYNYIYQTSIRLNFWWRFCSFNGKFARFKLGSLSLSSREILVIFIQNCDSISFKMLISTLHTLHYDNYLVYPYIALYIAPYIANSNYPAGIIATNLIFRFWQFSGNDFDYFPNNQIAVIKLLFLLFILSLLSAIERIFVSRFAALYILTFY